MNSTPARWAIAAVTIAVAYLIGAGTWSTPTTAVGTVAHSSSERAETTTRVVIEVAPQPVTAAPRPDTTELAALLAAEDELAQQSATVAARAGGRAERKTAAPAKAEQTTAKTSKAPAPAKAPKAAKAPSNEELAYRIDQLAEDTCERRAGGTVAEDYTCVGADFHGKSATPKAKAQGKEQVASADTVPLGEGKKRCPSGYSRDKTDRSLCVAKS